MKYALHQERVLLGDEMGLGKTIQAIATMVSLRNTGATHFVVVCPASVLTNWCREIRKMSRLSVTKVHGADRAEALQSWIKTGGVAVTTYETTGFFKLDAGFKFSLLVVDEAHYVKNPEAQRTKNVTNLSDHTERLLFMTGTALENKVDEMISLIKILQPTVASSVRGMEFLSSAPEFRSKVAPVYYRRKREDVLKELPDLIENMEWCTMTSVEEAVYEDAVLNKGFAAARRVSWNVDDLKDSSKAMRMKEIIEEAEDDGRKVIVFSFFLDTIKKLPKCWENGATGRSTVRSRRNGGRILLTTSTRHPREAFLRRKSRRAGRGSTFNPQALLSCANRSSSHRPRIRRFQGHIEWDRRETCLCTVCCVRIRWTKESPPCWKASRKSLMRLQINPKRRTRAGSWTRRTSAILSKKRSTESTQNEAIQTERKRSEKNVAPRFV